MNKLYKIIEVCKFYIKKNWPTWILVTMGILVVGNYTSWGSHNMPDIFGCFWDPLLGLLGIIITLGLTIFYAYNEWKTALDKKLIVHFINTQGQYLASCYNVNVLPNAELRALGLQVGQQLFGIQNLKFNPSISESGKEHIIYIKNHQSLLRWIQYYEITFKLVDDTYNQQSKFYMVWNISETESIKKKIEISKTPFHNQIGKNITTLLSEDSDSINEFKNLVELKYDYTLYIINASILPSHGTYQYDAMTPDDAIRMMKENNYISAVGHQSTAQILTDKVGKPVDFNRVNIQMNSGDQAIVFKIKSRMEEGKVYTRDELSGLVMEYGLLTRQN